MGYFMKPSFFFYLLFFIFLLIGCKKSTTPITTTQISLTAEYVGVTEAELHLQVDSSQPYDALQLLREGQPVLSVPFSATDTTLFDTTLLPAHTYTYQAALFYNARHSSESDELTITTMDTTSHDFQWEIFTFESPYGSAALYDVAIINENNIWAVGRIYADSLEPWVPYNAVHWNGNEWESKRIYFYTICGQTSLTPYPARSILAFNENDIWIAMDGDQLVHWNGNSQDTIICLPVSFSISKIWGWNSSSIFAVGSGGNILHYDGSRWYKLESGIDLPLQDIWGVVDWKTGKVNILAVACNLFYNDGIAVLQMNENSVSEISTTNLPANIGSVWSWKGREWYICGSGLYRTRTLDMPWEQVSGLPSIFQQKVRGNGPNDVFVVGHFGLVLHWNGSTWRQYSGLPGRYNGLAIQDDLVVVTGTKMSGILAGSGIILIGRRNL